MFMQLPSYVWLLLIIISQFMSTNLANYDTYVVHMDLSVMPKVFSSHHSWYMAILASSESDFSTNSNNTSSTTSQAKLIYVYTNAIHGFSASLTPSQFKTITNSVGYVSSTKDSLVRLTTTHSSQFLGLNPNYGAWPVSNYGKDVIIGLVDTGVWPESKSFDDSGMTEIPSRWKGKCESGTQFNSSMCNKKLIGARYFNKGLLANNPNLVITMNSTRDTNGHGTHTSSTAAGNYVQGASYFSYATGTARGMAPRARVAMYKTFSDNQSAYPSDILAALDQAIMDGVDVLSLSFGSDSSIPLYEDPIAIAAFAALERGIFVATAAGNFGPEFASLGNEAPWLLIVAAGTVDRELIANVTLGNGISITGLSIYSGNSSTLIQATSLVFMEEDSCLSRTELKKIGPKIVVCKDQNGTLNDQISSVEASTVAGVVFITNTDIDFDHISITFPAVFLNLQNGEIVLDYIKGCSHDHDPKASIEFQETRLGTKPAPRVSSFSSRGPSKSCPFVLKPDLMAPGERILASWPENIQVASTSSGQPMFTKFMIKSGTSMSCPHAAGVAALVKGVHPEWSPAAIRSAMMTTSDVLDNTLNPIQDKINNQPALALAMGAGHINPNKALDPGLIYDLKSEDYVNLLCALNFTKKQIQIITRSASYSCSNPSLDLNYPSFIAFLNANDSTDSDIQTVHEFKRTATHVGYGMSTYIAKLTPMDGLQVSVVPDKLNFKDKYEKKSYKLRIEGPMLMKDVAVYGSLSWVELGGKHVVKSPIVATNLGSETLILPWLIGGDFNVILNINEKAGGGAIGYIAATNFHPCMQLDGLMDPGFRGNAFTLCNKY